MRVRVRGRRTLVWVRTEVCARKDSYSLDGMIRVYRLKSYSLEMFSVCVNVMVYLECTFISA